MVTVLSGMLLGCAQTGPPLPPSLELPKPPSDLRATRKGNTVTLVWSEPVRTTDRQSVRYLGPTRICRSLTSEMTECGIPVGELPAPQSIQPPAATPPPQQVFTDTLPATILEQNPTGDVVYAVEVLNRDQRGAGLSNRATVAALPTLGPPADFHAELTGSGVAFTWTPPPTLPVVPGVTYRYRIYRRDEASGKETVASEIPGEIVGPPHAEDAGFEWEKTYLYHIAAVSVAARPGGDVQVEGDDSPTTRIIAHDVFPPAVPSGLQAVYSGEGQKAFVDLIWAPVTDADLAGYNMYRREGSEASVKLNTELVKTPSYRDSAVGSGKSYFYSVSAADVRGNESAHSEEASESVP
ncbi:MAG TPA: hypothetical protein VNW47_07165 [Terriglobales bacterium]|nr:hypothetical protein [Terriglobales bacterium]